MTTNEKAPCPYCNELLWVGVPDGWTLSLLGRNKDYDSNAHGRMHCPKCGYLLAYWITKKRR